MANKDGRVPDVKGERTTPHPKKGPWDTQKTGQPKKMFRSQLHRHTRDMHDAMPSAEARHGFGWGVSWSSMVIAFALMGALYGGLVWAFPEAGTPTLRPVMIFLPVLLAGVVAALRFGGKRVRNTMGKAALLWLFVFAGLGLLYRLFNPAPDMARDHNRGGLSGAEAGAYLVRRAPDGHFWLTVKIDQTPVRMLVDTGATNTVLSPRDARRIGLNPDRLTYSGVADTANGPVRFARVSGASLEVGNSRFSSVTLNVNGAPLEGSLLGMNILNRFESVEIQGDTLILRP